MSEHLDMQELIAAYATKALDDIEYEAAASQLLDHLAGCSSCRELYRDMSLVSAELALAAPPAQLPRGAQERMLRVIRSDGTGSRPPERRSRIGWLKRRVPVIAAALMLAALGVWNLSLGSDVRELRAAAERRDAALTLLNRSDVRRIALAGDRGGGMMHLVVAPNGVATLIGTNIPSLGDRVLEVWLIRDDGVPVPAAVLSPEFGTVIGLVGIDPDKDRTIAITIERGRVESPTGTPIFQASLRA